MKDQINRNILFVQFTDPAGYPPLQNAMRILENRGWKISILGRCVVETSKIKFEVPISGSFYWVPSSANRYLQYCFYSFFCLKAFFLMMSPRFAWIYGSDHWTLPILYVAKALFKKKIIYQEHDSPGVQQGFFMRLVLKLRPQVSAFSDIKIVPNLKRIPENLNRDTWFEVRNYPARQGVTRSVEKRKDALIAYYHGSINSARLPFSLLDAFEKIKFPFIFKFAGYESLQEQGYIKSWVESAQSRGLAEKVIYLGVLESREDLSENGSKAHVGLALMPQSSQDINMMHMCGASNKPYDYLASECALLVSDLPEWNEMYVQAGLGLNCRPDSAQSVENCLTWFYENLNQTIDMGKKGRKRILDDWNYEHAFEVVVNKMDEIAAAA